MHFFAYSSSTVLWGRPWDNPWTRPTIIPELQNRSVISVVTGKDRFAALTSSGKLLSWGKYSGGALGLGGLIPGSPRGHAGGEQTHTPPDVTVPTEVRFDHHEKLKGEGRVERYCFAVAALSDHTAALVVDLALDGVPPEDPKQNMFVDVYSPPVCNSQQLRVLRLMTNSTIQSAHDLRIRSNVERPNVERSDTERSDMERSDTKWSDMKWSDMKWSDMKTFLATLTGIKKQ